VRTDRLQAEYDVAIRWTVFPLHPEIPDEGMDLEELFAGRRFDIDAMMGRLKEVATALGLPLRERRRTFNSRRAQELAKWAEHLGRGDAFRAGVFRAYFAEGRNIARMDELASVAQAAGLPLGQAREVIEQGAFGPEVDTDWARCRELSIRAVPTFRARGRTSSGLPDYEDLSRLAEGVGARRRQN
jgi:predicted DsbA family dithiol-disulfide isomerase